MAGAYFARWRSFFLLLVLGSVLWVLITRFVNPPITATMAGDVLAGRGAERRWLGIERIDRDMVRAAIAAEDGAVAPVGFTRRYGSTIAARIAVVARDGLDACVYAGGPAPANKTPPVASKSKRPLPGDEYEGKVPAAVADDGDMPAPVVLGEPVEAAPPAVETAPPAPLEAAPEPATDDPAGAPTNLG